MSGIQQKLEGHWDIWVGGRVKSAHGLAGPLLNEQLCQVIYCLTQQKY